MLNQDGEKTNAQDTSRRIKMSNYTKEIEEKHKIDQEKLLLHKKHNDYYDNIR